VEVEPTRIYREEVRDFLESAGIDVDAIASQLDSAVDLDGCVVGADQRNPQNMTTSVL